MKRAELVRHLERHGCELLREGGSHTVYVHRAQRKVSTVPRHREVNEILGLRNAEVFADFECTSCRYLPARICIARQMMRTTLNIDDAALAAALDLAPGKTKTAVINDALREYARRKRLRGLRLFAGKVRWEGNLDALRKRRPRAS